MAEKRRELKTAKLIDKTCKLPSNKSEHKISLIDQQNKTYAEAATTSNSKIQGTLHSKSSSKLGTVVQHQKDKNSVPKLNLKLKQKENINTSDQRVKRHKPLEAEDPFQSQSQPCMINNLEINYLENQRLSVLADSLTGHFESTSKGLFQRDTCVLEEKDANRNFWHRRTTTDGEYGIVNRLNSTSKLETKVGRKLKENLAVMGDKYSKQKSDLNSGKTKKYWSPATLAVSSIDERAPANPTSNFNEYNESPEDESRKTQTFYAALGSDIVRQEDSSQSKGSSKQRRTFLTRMTEGPVKNFEYEGPAICSNEKTEIFKGLPAAIKLDKGKTSMTSDLSSLVYAVGGSSEKEQMTIESFDNRSNRWQEIFRSSIPLECRSKFGAIMVNNKDLLIFGGKTSTRRFNNSVLVDLAKGQLREAGLNLSEAKSGFGFCVFNSRPL